MTNNKKTSLLPLFTILALMVTAYILSFFYGSASLPVWKFALSPVLVLGSDSGATTIAVLIFLLILSAVSFILEKTGFLDYMLKKIAGKYAKKRYLFMAILVLFLMIMGSFVGSFEEVIPLVPLAVTLAKELGFDAMTGIGMSLLAAGCGFSAGVANPFTIGVAQSIAGLPMFSGFGFRIVVFILIYLLLMGFLVLHARKIATEPLCESAQNFVIDNNKERSLKSFGLIMLVCVAVTLSSPFLTFLQDYTMIIMALGYMIGGIAVVISEKLSFKKAVSYAWMGIKDVAPSIALILLASSIKYVMDETGTMEVLVNVAVANASSLSKFGVVMFIYLLCLIMEFFVSSGSAKAFLLMPILIPIANAFAVSPQLVILAYAFGDGFSNVIYPTNIGLLISLNLAKTDYKDWLKYSWKFQLVNFVLTSALLWIGLMIGY